MLFAGGVSIVVNILGVYQEWGTYKNVSSILEVCKGPLLAKPFEGCWSCYRIFFPSQLGLLFICFSCCFCNHISAWIAVIVYCYKTVCAVATHDCATVHTETVWTGTSSSQSDLTSILCRKQPQMIESYYGGGCGDDQGASRELSSVEFSFGWVH